VIQTSYRFYYCHTTDLLVIRVYTIPGMIIKQQFRSQALQKEVPVWYTADCGSHISHKFQDMYLFVMELIPITYFGLM